MNPANDLPGITCLLGDLELSRRPTFNDSREEVMWEGVCNMHYDIGVNNNVGGLALCSSLIIGQTSKPSHGSKHRSRRKRFPHKLEITF